MKTNLIAITIALALAAAAGGALKQHRSPSPATSPAGPKLVMAQTDFSFGEVKAGEELNHTFALKNEGTADLLIKNVAPS